MTSISSKKWVAVGIMECINKGLPFI